MISLKSQHTSVTHLVSSFFFLVFQNDILKLKLNIINTYRTGLRYIRTLISA